MIRQILFPLFGIVVFSTVANAQTPPPSPPPTQSAPTADSATLRTPDAPCIPPANVRWDLSGGGLRRHMLYLQLFNGGSVSLLVGYALQIASAMSIGVAFSGVHQFEISQSTSFPFTGTNGVVMTVPMRFRLLNDRFTLGARLEPGVGWFNPLVNEQRSWNFLLTAVLTGGYWIVEGRWLAGLSVEGSAGVEFMRRLFYGVLMAGPITQIQLTDWIALVADLKMGPFFAPIGAPGTTLSRRLTVGVAFAFD